MNRNSRRFAQTCLFLFCAFNLTGQIQPTQNIPVQPPIPKANVNYKTINPKLQYGFIINKPTKPNPKEGDQISIHMISVCNNRILYNSYQSMRGKPAIYGVSKPTFKGDLIEAIMLMTPGDSIACLADADAIFKSSNSKKPDFIKSGDKIEYFIKLVAVKTKETIMKEQQAAFQKQMKAMEAKQKADAARQAAKDDKLLKNYFTKNKLTPVKTKSGLYYIIKEEGKGDSLPKNGDNISVYYTGTFLNGKKFDSNEDSAFNHVQPLEFQLGRGGVIKAWDEGFTLLKPGSKATLYCPSALAYGIQSRPGSPANPKGIPANSILIFDVYLISSTRPAPMAPAPAAPVQLDVPKADTMKGGQ